MRNIFFPHYLSGEPVCARIILALKIFPGHICKVILVAGSKIIPCPEIPIKYLQSQFLFRLAGDMNV